MADISPDPLALAEELKRFPIFSGVPVTELQRLEVRKPQRPLRPGMILFRQGDITPWVYFIRRGVVEFKRAEPNKPPLRRLVSEGQTLGRLELDAKEGQLGEAKTLTQVEIIAVSLESLARLRASHPDIGSRFDRSDIIGQLRANPYFAPLEDIEIKWIADIVEVLQAQPNTILQELGQPIFDLVIMRQGRVRLEGDQGARWVSAGAVFGYRDLLAKLGSRFRAIVESPTRYFLLPREDFLNIIARHPRHDWTSAPFVVETLLQNVGIFRNLSQEAIRKLAGYVMQIHLHRPHHTLVTAGKEHPYCYILARGAALRQSITETGQTLAATIGPGAYFGENALLFRQAADETVETLEATDWVRIHHADFLIFLENHPEIEAQLNLTELQRQELRKLKRLESWQQAGERILFKSRRHWIVLVRRLTLLLPLIFLQLAFSAIYTLIAHRPPSLWLELTIGALYLLPVGGWILIDYLNDYHIITTKRIIHHEKVPLIRDSRLTAPIDQIQNLDIHRTFFSQILRYGELIISTAATEGKIVFDYLPHPSIAHRIISQEMRRRRAYSRSSDLESRQRELQKRLHIGLEEKIDERALVETTPKRLPKSPPSLPFLHLLGLQEKGNRHLVWRKHWIGLLRIIVPSLLILSLGAGSLTLLAVITLTEGPPLPFTPLFFIVNMLFVAAGFFWLWWKWEDWVNDRYIVSDEIVERVYKKPLWFDETRTTIPLERIQNVEFHRPNPLAYLLNYGNVDIQTAAQAGKITFEYVPAPAEVQFQILNRMQNYQRNLERRRQESQKKEMLEWLEAYYKLTASQQKS